MAARELARYQAENGEGTTPDASDTSPEASTIRKAITLAPTLMGTLEASGDGRPHPGYSGLAGRRVPCGHGTRGIRTSHQ